MVLDHVALLTHSLEATLARLADLKLPQGPIETFAGEGTREVYLGDADRSARLLLIEPVGEDGPYTRALAKRGAGLHHLGLHTRSLTGFLSHRPGWLLHPRSLDTWADLRTVWLARPGIRTLVEVHELGEETAGDLPPVIERVEVPTTGDAASLLEGVGASPSPDGLAWLTVGGVRHGVADLV